MIALQYVLCSIEDTLLLSDKPIYRYSFYPDSLNGFQSVSRFLQDQYIA